MPRLKDILHIRRKAEEISSSLPALMMQAEKIAASAMHGEHAQRKSGTGEKFWQYRPYHSGDRPQDIDWRQSGKTDHIFIKQREWQTTQRTYFWCASGKGMQFSSSKKLPTKQEAAQVLTLALALLMTRAEDQVGIFGDPKTGRSEHTIEKIARILHENFYGSNAPLPETALFIPPAHSALVMAGDFLAPLPVIESGFSVLSGNIKNAMVLQVLDPSEISLDFSGRVLFEGLQKSDSETIDSVSGIRAAYQKRMADHIESIKTLCRDHGWFYILHRTDQDASETLRNIWESLAQSGGRQ